MTGTGQLAGKVAVITGGASGMGAEAARLFTENGARVVIGDIQDEAGEALAGSLDNVRYVHTDVSSAASVKAMIDEAVSAFGRLDVLFSNAGISPAGKRIPDLDEEAFDRALAVNLKGAFYCMKYAIPHMAHGGGGSIITTGSIASTIALPNGPCYGSSKAAVVALTRACAIDHAADGIRANCIQPGGIVTGMSFRGRPDKTREEVEADFATRQPIPRAGLPIDIANAALFLASDASSFITGQTLIVDGGQLASGSQRWDPSVVHNFDAFNKS